MAVRFDREHEAQQTGFLGRRLDPGWFGWLDRFVPDSTLRAGGEPLRRTRLSLRIGLIALVSFIVAVPIDSSFGRTDFAIAAVLSCIALSLLPLVMRWTGSMQLHANGLILVIVIFATFAITASNAREPGSFQALAILPLLAMLLGGRTLAIFWTAVALLATMIPEELVRQGAWRPISPGDSVVGMGLPGSSMLLTVLMLALGLAWESLRKGVNAELQESELRFRAIAESAQVLLSEMDASGKLLYVSSHHLDFETAVPSELVGRNFLEFVHPEDQSRIHAVFEAVWRGQETGTTDLRLLDEDEEVDWRWFESSTRLYSTAEGEKRVLTLARECTERKRSEAELSQYREHLEDLVQERTRELVESQSRLRESERLASVGTLAAGIAHQVNNPVGAILAGCEYALTDDEAGPEGAESWRRTARQVLEENAGLARRCGKIVRSILQFARNERTEKWQEDLNAVVRRAVRACEARAEDRHSRLELALAPAELHALVSPIEIEQVIVNLIDNALLSREQGVSIAIRTQALDDEIEITIEDDGCGIDESDLPRIFDPFFTTRLERGGNGLGLSVAHGIVQGHGGRLEFESEPQRGTTARILLPRL